MRRRRGWLAPLVGLALVALVVLEVWLLIQVAQLIGIWLTLLVLVAEALLGAWLTRREGRRAWKALNEAFSTGRMPAQELTDTALVLVGALLLMLPGFATDLVGFCCLLPFTRPLARRLLRWLVTRRLEERLTAPLVSQFRTDTVIEGETVDVPTRPGPSPSDPGVITGEIEERPSDRNLP